MLSGNFIFSNNTQFLKALPPIDFNLFGNSTLPKLLHPSNAESPIFVTLFGIITSFTLQSANAYFGISSMPSSNSTFSNFLHSLNGELKPKILL